MPDKRIKALNVVIQKGFSLIEMVTVIVVLGVLAVMVTSFISFGTQIYVDSANRNDLTASARFAVERISRELRNALPNSVRVNDYLGRQCLEFVPIEASVIYLDIPVQPEPAANTINVVTGNTALNNINQNQVAIYVLNTSEVYNTSGTPNKIHDVSDITMGSDTNNWSITLDGMVHFEEDSPTSRLFFINSPVSYCVEGTNLTRHENYAYSNGLADNEGVLMAESLNLQSDAGYEFPFTVTDATQNRNAIVLANFKFTRNFEDIYFNTEVQVPNVP